MNSLVMRDYAPAFVDTDTPCVTYYNYNSGKVESCTYSRGELWSMACKAASLIRANGLRAKDHVTHCFSANRVEDLALRLATIMTGTIPVTVNWQADSSERVNYKIDLTKSKMVFTDFGFDSDIIAAIKKDHPSLPIVDISTIHDAEEMREVDFCVELGVEESRIVIFTSGTTGMPKGVALPYRSYGSNRTTFEDFLQVKSSDDFAVLIVNPLHHTNSTAITDWALRRPKSHIHLVEKYSTPYWKILNSVVEKGHERVIAPVVARHFDFLECLDNENRLPLDIEVLKQAMSKVDFLIGSAPVGPGTIERLLKYSARIPIVRFGSTETCLQVIGLPYCLNDKEKYSAFKAGWNHTINGESKVGYYIGRKHIGNTDVRIVKSITDGAEGYFEDCDEGEPGYLITKGSNLMSGYVNSRDATEEVFHDSWYTGLGDICFSLKNNNDGEDDIYWMSRDSMMLIRGGSNYAYNQIDEELKSFAAKQYNLPNDCFDIAVVGLKYDSEHDDSCCVTMEFFDDKYSQNTQIISETFISDAAKKVSKGAKPDYFRLAKIPRNFKNAVLVKDLAREFTSWLNNN